MLMRANIVGPPSITTTDQGCVNFNDNAARHRQPIENQIPVKSGLGID
jgi:hypothetical protein